MTALAMVFPGQGSQSPGMCEAWAARPEVAATLDEADDVLGRALSRVIQSGPADELDLTVNTQPAMLVVDVALWRAWQAAGGPAPQVLAGHSLGEYAALVAAEVLEFSDALKLVQQRAEAMQSAVPQGEGAMAAIIGLDEEQVLALCEEQAQGDCLEAVNFNAPGQIVVAGHASAVDRILSAAKPAGARLARRLPVSVPAHSRLMAPVAETLAGALAGVTVKAPAVPVLHNVDGAPREKPQDIREALAQQVMQPVRWVTTQRAMAKDYGVSHGIECGPGQVLCGLAKRSVKSVAFSPLAGPAAMQTLIEEMA